MIKRKIFIWSVISVLFVILMGSLFHFMYEWTEEFKKTAFLFPVNESVWEHLKMVLYPTLIFMLVEYIYLKDEINNYILSRVIGIITSMIFIVGGFYFYTATLGTHSLIIDISLFVLSIIFGQILTYKIFISKQLPQWANKISILIICLTILLFIVYTYFPPRLPIFKDNQTDTYGIIYNYVERNTMICTIFQLTKTC